MEAGQPPEQLDNSPVGILLKSVLAVVRDGDERLNDRVDELAAAFEGLQDKSDFDLRVASLAAARAHVTALTERRNSRGFEDYKLTPDRQIEQELKVASYLMGEQ